MNIKVEYTEYCILKRNITLDILKLVLAFMVVGIHAEFLADISILGQYLTVNGILSYRDIKQLDNMIKIIC